MAPGEDLLAPGFSLEFQSIELFECLGYQLITENKSTGSSITIRLVGAQQPLDCNPSMVPATGKIFLDITEGEYSFKVQYQTHEAFEGELTITPESRLLSVKQTGQIVTLSNPKLNRIPKNLIWGKIEFRDEKARADIQGFFEEIQSLGASITDLEIGNYGPFYIREQGIPKERKLSNGTLEQHFNFFFMGDLQSVRDLAKKYVEINGNRMKISIFSASGNSETGWSLTK